MRVLVLGAGLAGLAAADRLVDHGARVVVVDSFPLPGGRVASFDVPVAVAGLLPGDVVEHGLHAWFQHYHALLGLMARAGVPKPPFAGRGIHFWAPDRGHYVIEGGPGVWFLNALKLPEEMRGPRKDAIAAFSRLIAYLDPALGNPTRTDRESAIALLRRMGVPEPAIDHVFRRCLFSLTSLPFEELSALELLRWMSFILPDPRIRCLDGGGTAAMCAPIADYLRGRGVDFRFGVEVRRLGIGEGGRVLLELAQAPDRTGVRHILVQGFRPATPPNPVLFDAVVCTLPWERLLAVSGSDPTLATLAVFRDLRRLENLHPFTIRLWFERPIAGAEQAYILSSGTVFDVLRPTRTAEGGEGISLIDALVDNVATHLTELPYDHERFIVEKDGARPVEDRILADLERLYPGQIRGNPVTRRFLHTREGILACRPGVWSLRPPQYVGLRRLVLAGDYTRQPWGVCMEGATRSGQLAVESLLTGRQSEADAPWAFQQVAHSVRSIFERV
ncbi:MAG TPA: FAD-dependent oxidoreductase [Polyangiaceae bacterium]|jgi:15-cis-phytoene desaturase|nr:FAD-dependent oxidoreductase [Polyangiaceae bacterium]